METKKCLGCNRNKYLNEFYKDVTHSDGLSSKCKDCRKQYPSSSKDRLAATKRKHRQNPTTKAKIAEYVRNRRKQDVLFNLAEKVRDRMRKLVSKNKVGSGARDLGCSLEFFKEYLEERFDEHMTWNNYGAYWELDHVWPLSMFNLTDRDDFLAACHYSNIQPLSKDRNRKKGNRAK